VGRPQCVPNNPVPFSFPFPPYHPRDTGFRVPRKHENDRAPALVYDEEHDPFRFRDGKFAFSREWADWPLLRKRGRMRGELP
jgi:hypothetical protein